MTGESGWPGRALRAQRDGSCLRITCRLHTQCSLGASWGPCMGRNTGLLSWHSCRAPQGHAWICGVSLGAKGCVQGQDGRETGPAQVLREAAGEAATEDAASPMLLCGLEYSLPAPSPASPQPASSSPPGTVSQKGIWHSLAWPMAQRQAAQLCPPLVKGGQAAHFLSSAFADTERLGLEVLGVLELFMS